jgi:hypothetical protein
MNASPTTRAGLKTPAPRIPQVLVAILCVLLILFVGAAQTLHRHASDEATSQGCSLCVVAHASVQVAAAPAAVIRVETVTSIEPSVAVASAHRYLSFQLYVRPPPVRTTLS